MPGHAFSCHRGSGRRCCGYKSVISRRHRAVLAGTATGLVLHFARDIAEGPPRCQNALATSRHGVDRQLLVIPEDDHGVYGCQAAAGERRHTSNARPSLRSYSLRSFISSCPVGQVVLDDR